MKTSIPRLRRVKHKAGGADVTVVYPSAAGGLSAELRKATGAALEHGGEHDVVGFASVIFWGDGGHSVVWRTTEETPFHFTLLPSAVHDALSASVLRTALGEDG